MLYSALTSVELARWVYAAPTDREALAEMIHRASGLAHGESNLVAEIEAELTAKEDQHRSEINLTLSDLHATEERLKVAEACCARLRNSMEAIHRISDPESF